MNFTDVEARLVQLEDEMLGGAAKVMWPPFKLAYKGDGFLAVRDTEPGDLPQRDIVFNGWRIYDMRKKYYVNTGGSAPRYLTRTLELSTKLEDAWLFDTEDEACEHCTDELARSLNCMLTVDEL